MKHRTEGSFAKGYSLRMPIISSHLLKIKNLPQHTLMSHVSAAIDLE